jgi:hypothetical protein
MVFTNLSVLFAISTITSIPTILTLKILGFVPLKGWTMTFVGISMVLPALAAALPEHPGVKTLAEMEVVVWELFAQLVTMAGRISLGLGQNLLLESEDLGSSEEESSNSKAMQEDADQLMGFKNGDNES